MHALAGELPFDGLGASGMALITVRPVSTPYLTVRVFFSTCYGSCGHPSTMVANRLFRLLMMG